MGTIITILLGVVASLIADGILVLGKPLAKWVIKLLGRLIINKSVERLPEGERDRCREEWLADLNDIEGLFGKLRHALSCALNIGKVKAVLQGKALNPQLPPFCVNTAEIGPKDPRLLRVSRVAMACLAIVTATSVLLKGPPNRTLTESRYQTSEVARKIGSQMQNRAVGSSPSAAHPIATSTSPNSVNGVALVPNGVQGVTPTAQPVNRGLPWDTSSNQVIAASSPFINSEAVLAGRPDIGNGMPISTDIIRPAANLGSAGSPLSNGSSLLASALSPSNGASTLNTAAHLNTGVLAAASPTVLNVGALLGGDPTALGRQTSFNGGIRPWASTSEAIGVITPQFATVTPMLGNGASLATSIAIISVAEQAGASDFRSPTVAKPIRLASSSVDLEVFARAGRAEPITPNYLASHYGVYQNGVYQNGVYQNGVYQTASVGSMGSIVLAPPPNPIGALTLVPTTAILLSSGPSIVEPAFLVSALDTLRPPTVAVNALVSQGLLGLGINTRALVGCDVVAPIVSGYNAAISLSQPIIGISPSPFAGQACTGL
jgi:hypothetical protein